MLRMGRRHPAGLPGYGSSSYGNDGGGGLYIVDEPKKLGQIVPRFILTGGGSVRASLPPQASRLLTLLLSPA